MVAPRVFCIPARAAPVVAVLRRGPSDWSHVGRWDIERAVFEPGAWIHGNLYPQRCDLSPDGRWLSYFTLRGRASWKAGTTYIAISRLPWLHALAAWGTAGTWTRGARFVDDPRAHALPPPDEGEVGPLGRHFGLVVNRAASFAVERRHGWRESDGTPPRDADDMWDQRRGERIVMCKSRPGSHDIDGGVELTVRGEFAAFREGPFRGDTRVTDYTVRHNDTDTPLTGVQWADWDARGRLLVATTDGRLQIRADPESDSVLHEVDLNAFRPDTRPAPGEARQW